MNPRRIVWLVARREVRTRTAGRAYRIGTALMVVAVVALIVVIAAVGGTGSAERIGVTRADAGLAEPLRAAARSLGQDVDVETVRDRSGGEARVRDGSLDALVVTAPEGATVIVDDDLGAQLRATLAAAVRQRALDAQVAELGGDPAAFNRELAQARLDVRALDPDEPYAGERIGIAMTVGVLVYLALLLYGQLVAQGVVEEKSSRVVEVLLSTIRAWQLMAGKVLGIGIAGLVQLALVLAAGAAAGLATGVLSLPASIAVETVAWSVLWFVIGFFLYALLFAATGALVSRQEDVGGVTMPLTMAIVIPYVIGVSVLPADPENGLVAVLSVIPFGAPMLMPMRLALGDVPAIEIAVAIVLSLALILLLVRLAGRMYSNAVMRIGGRVGVADALRAP